MTKPAQLEVFDFGIPIEAQTASGPSQEWQDGHAIGLQEALAATEAESLRLKVELVQTLSDKQFGYQEAKAEILNHLTPLFEALVTGFLPRYAQATLVPMLREELMATASACLDTPITIGVAPQNIEALSDVLAETPQLPFVARSDPSLALAQATFSGGPQDQMIDLDGLLAMVQETLASLTEAAEERTNHG